MPFASPLMQWHSPCSSVMLGNDMLCQSLLPSHAVPQVNCLLTWDTVSQGHHHLTQWTINCGCLQCARKQGRQCCVSSSLTLSLTASCLWWAPKQAADTMDTNCECLQLSQCAREQGQNDVSHSLTLNITTMCLWLTPRWHHGPPQ